jgi:hypothetical protein
MKMFKTKSDVDDLRELRQRKAELKLRIEAEQVEIRSAWQDFRANMEPVKIAADVAQSLLGFSDSNGKSSLLLAPLRLAADLFIGSSRAKLLFTLAAPLALTYLPQLTNKIKGFSLKETKPKIYGALRKGVAGLRSQLRRKKADAPSETEADDIVQPS